MTSPVEALLDLCGDRPWAFALLGVIEVEVALWLLFWLGRILAFALHLPPPSMGLA